MFDNSVSVIVARHPLANFHHCLTNAIHIYDVPFNSVELYPVAEFINFVKEEVERASNAQCKLL